MLFIPGITKGGLFPGLSANKQSFERAGKIVELLFCHHGRYLISVYL